MARELSFGISVQGNTAAVSKEFERLVWMAGPNGRKRLLGIAGHRMAQTEVPLVFRRSGPGWLPNGRPGSDTLKDTGRLRDSIDYRVDYDRVLIGTNVVYANVHNQGGVWGASRVLTSKRPGGFLAIPLSPPLTESQRRVSRPRDFPNAFVVKIKWGGLFIAQKSGRGLRFLFRLVKQVRIPARPFLNWTETALGNVLRLWADALAKERP